MSGHTRFVMAHNCDGESPVSKVPLYFLTFRTIVFALATHWCELREVPARRNRADKTIRLLPALWVEDLKSKAWVTGAQ
jgi:hypothetical protein